MFYQKFCNRTSEASITKNRAGLEQLFPPEASLYYDRFQLFDNTESFSAKHNIIMPDPLLSAVVSRKRDYLMGRYCAKQALLNFGSPTANLTPGKNGCPIWPKGVIGSISHTNGMAVAVVADQQLYSGIGVDMEKRVSENEANKIMPVIGAPEEWEIITHNFQGDIKTGFTVLFSAKESIYKALYPSVNDIFDFSEARLASFAPEEQRLEFILSPYLIDKTHIAKLWVLFCFSNTYIFSGVCVQRKQVR